MAQADTFDSIGRQMRGRLAGVKDWLKPTGLSAEQKKKMLRQRLFTVFGIVVFAIALIWGVYWFLIGSNYVSTDDAYVDASLAQITPRVNGTIDAVPVKDTDHVKKGDVLVRIDPSDARLALAQAEANYNQSVRQVEQYFANVEAAKAQVNARKADLQRAQVDYRRRAALANTGAVSGDEMSAARNALDTAKAGLTAAQRQLSAQQALIAGSDVMHNPEVLAAKAQRDRARLDLARTVIRAPINGVVAQNMVQVGQHVQVGAKMMSVVPVDRAYVNANFKEGQLEHVRPGQTVTLTSDLYGSGVVFHGHVLGLGGGTGAAFAVIPAQNATGNWIKVVQRLPVRIALDPEDLAKYPLRVGLSMTATINISQ
jgi:membrane fusion protein (multidrug efflux system)